MSWIFLLHCVGSLHLNQYAFRALFLKKLGVHLKDTLADSLFWICLVHFVILLHFVYNLAPMNYLLFHFWFRSLSFKTTVPLLYTNDL